MEHQLEKSRYEKLERKWDLTTEGHDTKRSSLQYDTGALD